MNNKYVFWVIACFAGLVLSAEGDVVDLSGALVGSFVLTQNTVAELQTKILEKKWISASIL